MKRANIFLTALLLCIGMGARADNVVAIGSAEGAPGDEVTVSIGLTNSDALSSLQLSIPIDENLTLVEGSAQVGSRCAGHSANVGVKDGALQVVVYSLSMATIAPGSGDVATFRLKLGSEPVSVTLQSTKTMLTDGNGNTVNGSCQSGTVTIRCAKAQFDTDEIDFGRVPIRSTYTREVAVTNVGNADLVVSSLEFSDVNVFSSTTQLPKTIAPGTTADINVTFAPTERGATERQLRIVSNSATRNRAIKLKALPYAVNELHIGDASGISDEEVTITMRMNNMDDISGYQVEFVLPSSLQYVDGSFAINDSRKQDHVGAASIVDGTLRLLAYSPSGKPLKGNDGEIGSFRVKLVGRKSEKNLTPIKTVLSATINNKVENVVSDVYGGRVTIQYPTISTANEIDFGAVSVTEVCKQTFSIKNGGNAPLTISRIVFNNEHLSVEEAMPLVIPKRQSSNVTVVYSSMEETAFEAKMQIYSNDPDRRLHEVNVRGSRFAPNYLGMQIPDVFEEENVKVNLSVNTYDDVTGLQFDMEYPNSVYEPFDDNIQLSERAKGMTVSSRQMSPNTIRYVCYFLGGGGIAAGEGEVMSISLKPVAEVVPVGTYTVSIKNVKMGTTGLADKYAGSDVSGSFQVKKHNPVTITAKSYTRLYGDANPTFEYTSEGAAVVGQPEFSCEATVTSPIGVYPIHISKGSVTNEEDTYVDGTLTITKAPLTIAAETYTKKQGEAMPEFVLSYEGFKNNETKDVLTKQAVVSCEATEASAPGEYPITVSGAEAQNYEISYVSGKLIVTDADPVTVTANSYTITYGDAIPEFGYTSNGATLDGTPTISCEATSTSPVGTYPIVISKGSVTNYNDKYVNGTLTITKAPLTIAAGNYTKKQGEAMPEFVLSYEGFKNNETKDVLTKQAVVSCEATEASAPGEYPVTVAGAEAQNYNISYVSGKLIVTDADPVTVTANSYTITYGDAIPEFGYRSSGATLDGTPTISCEGTSASPVGTYPIVISKGSVTNYNDKYVNGTLTITKAPLTIAAGNYTKKQGEAMPEFVLSYEGFKNNETKDVLTKQAVVSCEATEASAPGEYAVTVAGAEAQNYNISYVSGKLTVVDETALDNTLAALDAKGLVGSKTTLAIALTNANDVSLCQFDLRLPEGVTVALNARNKLDATLTDRASTHTISSRQLSNGDYRFVVSSNDGDSFVGNEGTLMNIVLDIAEDAEAGNRTIRVLNIELSLPEGNDLRIVNPADAESTLTISSYKPGDVNGDDKVSVTDVGYAINYILEQVPSVFIFDAADMNHDGKISVTDVGYIINIILSDEGPSHARRRTTAQNMQQDGVATLAQSGTEHRLFVEAENCIGFQMDVMLPQGIELSAAHLDPMSCADHILTFRQVAENKYRILCYSPTNSTLNRAADALLSLTTTAATDGMTVTDILFTTASLDEVAFVIGDDATGIASMGADGKDAMYDLQGRRVDSNRLHKGIYLTKGRKSVKK